MPPIAPPEDSGGPVAALIFQGVCKKNPKDGKMYTLDATKNILTETV